MKKSLLFILVLGIPLSAALAQLRVGAKAGINVASWLPARDLPPPTVWSPITRATAGIFSNYEFSIFAVQCEANFIQKGVHGSYFLINSALTINMIEFPVLFRINIPVPYVHPYVFGGFAYGVVSSARSRGSDGVSTFDLDWMEELRKDETSALFGIGGEVDVSRRFSLLMEVRYSTGVHSIQPQASTEPKNYGIQMQIGFVTEIL